MNLQDVTLREGDQLPGRDYTVEQKVECARALDDLGVQFVQPGFPATGEKDRAVFSELAGRTDAEVVALARALESDVDAALDADADVVEVFAPVSDRQLEHLLGNSREEMLAMVGDAVDSVQDRGGTPHVTLADAFRTPQSRLVEVFEHVPDVPIVTLADSVGVRTPVSVQSMLDGLAAEVDLSRVGVHFHDDVGCATANALVACEAGVGKADVSVASLGERAGNTALEELVVACTVEFDDDLGVEATALVPTCRRILDTLDEDYGDRKAVLGQTVTEHESSIHVAAMLQDPGTLEPYDPSWFGGERRLLFGESTGTSAARTLLERADVEPDDTTVSSFLSVLGDEGPVDLEAALDLARREFGS